MKNSMNYFDDAKTALGIDSDYAMAKWLGVTRGAVSSYRTGARIYDDYTAARIAEALKIDPMVVISAANVEREKDEGRRGYWQKYWERLGGLAASILLVVTLIVTPTPSQAAPVLNVHFTTMYIMLNY